MARAQGHGWRLRRGGDDRSATQAHDNGDPDRPAACRNDAPSRSLGALPDDSSSAAGGEGPGYLRLRRHTHQRRAGALAAQRIVSAGPAQYRSEEHTSELQSLMRLSYAVFCLKTKKTITRK